MIPFSPNKNSLSKIMAQTLKNPYAETLVAIDGDFLGSCIQHDQDFYTRIYPDRRLDNIELANLCQEILLNTKVIEVDKVFTFVIFHSQARRGFPFVKETFEDVGERRMTAENLSVEFHVVETPTAESLCQHIKDFMKLLNQHTATIAGRETNIKKVIFCADNPVYDTVVNAIHKSGIKDIAMIRKTYESKMNVKGVNHFNVDYLVGKALGLSIGEL